MSFYQTVLIAKHYPDYVRPRRRVLTGEGGRRLTWNSLRLIFNPNSLKRSRR